MSTLKHFDNVFATRENNIVVGVLSRTNKHRALKKMKDNLPATPRKRAAVLSSYLSSTKSPTIDTMQKLNKIPSPEDTKNVEIYFALVRVL